MPTSGSPVSGASIRWPWLLLCVGGLLACIALLVVSLPQARPKRSSPNAKGRPPGPVVSQQQAATSPAPPPPPAMAPTMDPVKAPALKRAERESAPEALPEPPRPHPKLRPPPRPMMPAKKAKKPSVGRGASLEDDIAPAPAAELAKAESPAKPQAPVKSPRPKAERPSGSKGKGGPGKRIPEGRLAAKDRRADERRDADDDAEGGPQTGAAQGSSSAEAEGAALAKLLPGRFHAKVPTEMRLNVSARVKVVVSDERADNEAKATLEAATVSTGGGPAQVVNADVLIGKLLKVELRALSSEFEIMAITPAEQRVVAGRVSTWEWAVVPHAEGEHQLSAIVTNITDWNGRPLDLTVQEITVNVEVSTMEKLRAVGGLISSGISGLAGLLGAWMGVLRPLLKRRREQEEDERDTRDRRAPAAAGPDPAAAKPADANASQPVPPAAAAAPAAAKDPAAAPPGQS